MHICYFLQAFPRVSETFISDEIYELLKRGHRISIVTLNVDADSLLHKNAEYVISNSDLKCLRLIDRYSAVRNLVMFFINNPFRFIKSAYRYLKNDAPIWVLSQLSQYISSSSYSIDHIHVHFADKQVVYAESLAKWLGVPFSFTMHGYDIRDLPVGKKNLLRLEYESKFIVSVSRKNKDILMALGLNGRRIKIIPCGINCLDFLKPAADYIGGELNVVCVARLHPIKRHENLLMAIKLLVNDKIPVKLRIVGDGALREELVAVVAALNIKNNVVFEGDCEHDKVICILRKSNIHVLCSSNEGQPVANLEAMAMGLAVICTSVGGIPEVINDGENGFLVAQDNPVELAKSIGNIYNNPALWKKVSNNARRLVMDKYSIEKTVDSLLFEILN